MYVNSNDSLINDPWAETIQYLLQGKNYLCRADEDEVCEGFHEHSEFLITSMLEGQEGLVWQNSPMFQYLKHKFMVGHLPMAMKNHRILTKGEGSICGNPAKVIP